MNSVKSVGRWTTGLAAMALSGMAVAEPLGMLNGRSADVSRSPDRSVEVGAVFGDLGEVDYQFFGGRYNHKLNPQTVVYGDLGQAELEYSVDVDGLAYGVGAFHQIDGVFTGTEFGVHASLHRTKLTASGRSGDISFTSIMIEGHFSGKDPINENGNMFWNASLGLNRTSGEGNSDTELAFGGGIILKNATNTGEFHAGALHVDDLIFGIGYRHFLN